MKAGIYRAVLQLRPSEQIELPFTYELKYEHKKPIIIIHNADERIRVDEIKIVGDSVFIQMPVFDTEFRCKILPDGLQGNWINHYKSGDNIIPFRSYFGQDYRFFPSAGLSQSTLNGKWQTTFSPESKDMTAAVGLFKQMEGTDLISGTFLTETGDYRYLEGIEKEGKLYLSAFDGSHAFVFVAEIKAQTLKGEFYSGAKWKEPWIAIKNEKAALRDAEEITTIKNPEQAFTLSMKDLNGKVISLEDSAYRNKPLIIQLMGSWCPNCMDESAYFSQLYKKYETEGLEIIALAFEKTTDPEKVKIQVNRLVKRYEITYPILLPLVTGKEKAGELLPRLSAISAFPTTLFLNKQHQVVKIHTGFSGPATGQDYIIYKERTENLIKHLMQE